MKANARDHEDDYVDTIMRWLTTALVLGIIVYLVRGVFTGPVISFGPSASINVTDARRGDYAYVIMPVHKHRDCEIDLSGQGPVIVQGGLIVRPPIWSRDGPYLAPADGWQLGQIKFLVPGDMGLEPGPAAFQFEGRWQCLLGPKYHRSPAREFMIVE